MKVLDFKVYQPVYFAGKQMPIFNQQNAAHLDMTIIPVGIQVQSDVHRVIIGWANIVYANVLRNDAKTEKASKPKAD